VTPRKPILAEPQERYWRARANRRVRKARLTRNVLRWSLVIAVNVVFLGGLAFLGLRAAERLRTSDEFAVRAIEIQGVERASEREMRDGLAFALEQNLLDLDLARVDETVRRDPWVAEASVRRVLPRTLRVRITERKPAALARIHGETYVVDETGFVVGKQDGALEERIPTLTGLDEREGLELAAALRRGVALVRRLESVAGPFADVVSELDLSSEDRVVARTTRGGPSLVLDPERIERNVLRYLALGSGIEKTVGPLNYVDLRWRDRIAVMPAVRVPEKR